MPSAWFATDRVDEKTSDIDQRTSDIIGFLVNEKSWESAIYTIRATLDETHPLKHERDKFQNLLVHCVVAAIKQEDPDLVMRLMQKLTQKRLLSACLAQNHVQVAPIYNKYLRSNPMYFRITLREIRIKWGHLLRSY